MWLTEADGSVLLFFSHGANHSVDIVRFVEKKQNSNTALPSTETIKKLLVAMEVIEIILI